MKQWRIHIWETDEQEDTYKEWMYSKNKPSFDEAACEVGVSVDRICMISEIR